MAYDVACRYMLLSNATKEQLSALKAGFGTDEKPEYKLFDLTSKDVFEIQIKKSMQGHCYITDGSTFYSGFILNKKKDTQTVCEIVFYPSSQDGLYIPRLTFSKTKVSTGEIKDSIKKEKVRIAFDGSGEGMQEFWKMISFLSQFKELVNLGDFKETYRVVGSQDVVLKLKNMSEHERIKEIVEYAEKSDVDASSLSQAALYAERQSVLGEFDKLLNEADSINKYRVAHVAEIKSGGDEAVWHHFLRENSWLLGLNLDIRFIADFTDEVSVGNPDTTNQGNPKVDLMGIMDYTVLIELKTAETEIFTSAKTQKARTGTWSFTTDFIEGFSQCMAQKFAWDKESGGKNLVVDGEILDPVQYRTIDPKTILIVGNKKKEFPMDSKNMAHVVKRDTFERFRRNNRNVEILTYDELYDRAHFIVFGHVHDENVPF